MPKAPLAECHLCPLNDKPCAPTQNPDKKVAFVARSPGYHEAVQGKPFAGPSGEVLNHLLKMNGVEREDVLLTNVVLCAPEAGKVPPEAIKACAPRLRNELRDCNLIIAGGTEAVNLLVGRGSIDSYRGYRIRRGSVEYVATNNPALVLRDDSTFPNLTKDFKRAFNPLPQPPFPKVEVIEDGRLAKDFTTTILNEHSIIGVDLETRGGLGRGSTIVSCQIATKGSSATVLGERGGIFEDRDFLEHFLRPLLESRRHTFIWWNGKYDTKVLRNTYGIEARVDEDGMLLSYACDERGGVHGLEYNLAEEYGWPDYEPASVKSFKKSGNVTDYDELYNYAGWDVAGTYQLWVDLTARAETEGTTGVYRKLLIPGSETLRILELNGFKYNTVAAADMYELEVGPELEEIQETLRSKLNKPLFNPRSHQQIAALYYDEWRIRHEMQKRPDMSRSVDDAARTEVSEGRFTFPEEDVLKFANDELLRVQAKVKREFIQEVVALLDRASKLQKQASTYILGMIDEAAKDSENRIYTGLYLHNTTSGRLSSREPNLQNITRTKEDLPDVRKLFVSSEGRLLVQADYSQAELRCIAQFSGDPTLTRVYTSGEDLHNLTAERFFGVGFTKEQRSISKNCNFGMFYEQAAKSFQEKHGIPEPIAQKYIDWAHTEFPRVWEWEDKVHQEVHTNSVTSPFGRRRRFYLLTKENKNACYREAVNFYPQTTASDFTLLSLIQIAKEVDLEKARLVLTVHDSILADVLDNYIDTYSTICKQVMESRPKDELGWDIPFLVDIGVGPDWGHLE